MSVTILPTNRHLSLQDLLANDDFHLTDLFKSAFMRDLSKALVYLHDTLKIAHGQLNTDTCLVSQYWSLKLTDFGLNAVLGELVHRGDLVVLVPPSVNGMELADIPYAQPCATLHRSSSRTRRHKR